MVSPINSFINNISQNAIPKTDFQGKCKSLGASLNEFGKNRGLENEINVKADSNLFGMTPYIIW